VPLLVLSLKRSGSTPIRLNIDKGDYDRFVAIIPPYQKEYDTLWLDLKWDKLLSVSRLTSGSVSRLRVLTLNVDFAGRDPTVSTHLPFSRASVLRELTLYGNIPTIFDSFRFPTLTALSLFSVAPMNQTKVLELLRVSPCLKRVDFFFFHLTAVETPCPPVLLQDLRWLRINAVTFGDSHLQLFTKLICPVAEDVGISHITFGNLTVLPFPSSWGFFPGPPQVRAMELQAEKSQVEITYAVGLLYGEAPRFENSCRFFPQGDTGMSPINHHPRELPMFQAAVRSLRALSPNGVTRLSVTGVDPSTFHSSIQSEISSSIRELLADVGNLETVTLSSGCLPAACLALAPQLSPPTVLCPSLDSVEVLLPIGVESEGEAAELATVFEARAAVGRGIRNLTITTPKPPTLSSTH